MGDIKNAIYLRWMLGAGIATGAIAALLVPHAQLTAAALLLLVGLVLAVLTYRKFVKGRAAQPATWSVVLLLFPLVCSLRTYSAVLALAGMAGLLILAISQKRIGRVIIPSPPLAALAIASAGVVLRPTSWLSTAFVVLAFVVLMVAVCRCSRHSAASSIIDGVGLYLVINVIGYYVVGLRSPGAASRLGGLEAADGGVRVIYPLASSLNLPPVLAAAFLAATLILFERGPKKVLRLVCCAAAIVVLLGAESRTSLIVAVAVFAGTLVVPRVLRIASLPMAAGSLLLAFAFGSIVKPLIAPAIGAITAIVPWLSRNATASADISLNGREYIWEQSVWVLGWAPDFFERWFGYGAQGQFLSEASYAYAYVFGSSLANPYTASVHNSMLQQVFDAGVIGAAALGAMAIMCLWGWNRLAREATPHIGASLAMAFSLVVSSATEVSLAPGVGQETFWVFVALLLIAYTRAPLDSSGREDTSAAEHDTVAGISQRPEHQRTA